MNEILENQMFRNSFTDSYPDNDHNKKMASEYRVNADFKNREA